MPDNSTMRTRTAGIAPSKSNAASTSTDHKAAARGNKTKELETDDSTNLLPDEKRPKTLPKSRRIEDKWKRDGGRVKLQHHELPCLLCDRVNELARRFLVKEPSVLERHCDMASWIHKGEYKESYQAPLWYRNSSCRVFYDSGSSSSLFSKVHYAMRENFKDEDHPSSLSWYSSEANSKESTQVILAEKPQESNKAGDAPTEETQPSDNKKGSHKEEKAASSSITQMTKVISFSLYREDLDTFPFYWLGLKLNIDAVKVWFCGWKIQLYAEKSLTERPFFGGILQYAHVQQVSLEVIHCKEGSHPMLERYRPLMEQASGICVVRDIDSILSLTDAKMLDAWLQDSKSDVLAYREYKMTLLSLGGGVAVKLDNIQREDGDGNPFQLDSLVGKTRGRNEDEWRLHNWLVQVTDNGKRIAEVQTRATESGLYCVDFYRGNLKIVWSSSFIYANYDNSFDFGPEYVFKGLSESECDEKCRWLVEEKSIDPSLHIHSHKRENRRKLIPESEPTCLR